MIDVYKLHEKKYRLNNLYKIVDRHGESIPFVMTDVQEDVFDGLHTRNLILKARQLGMSTFSVLYLLDEVLFNRHLSAGIVSYSLQHAQHIFKKIIGHALDNLPKQIGHVGIVGRSATEITLHNGSSLRVDTSLRGGTCQLILISEFGKTCARSPAKAEEIVAGTLNTVPTSGRVIIESTGEGTDGYFADMVNAAATRGNDNLSPLEYKLFFYPWYTEESYVSSYPMDIDVEHTDYFKKIETDADIELTREQKFWYLAKERETGDKMRQEFPSTVGEAFLTNSDAYYFAQGVQKAYEEDRILSTSPYDALHPVYVAMDIGATDLTVMIYFQVVHGEVRIIDYYTDTNKGTEFYAQHLLASTRYVYARLFLPHDAKKRDGIVVENTYHREMSRLFEHTATRVQVLKRSDKQPLITNAKIKLDRCVFDGTRCKDLISKLQKYRKTWHEPTGRYIDKPLHDINSHAADAFQYVCQAVSILEAAGDSSGALEAHRAIVDSRRDII